MKKTLLLFLFVAITTISFSQTAVEDGYVINLIGDTIRGTIKYNYKNDILLFSSVQLQTKNDKKTYRPNQIKEFSVDEEIFKSKIVDGVQVFVKILSSGSLILYEYKTEHYFLNKTNIYCDYYLESYTDSKLIHIKKNKFRKQLSNVMFDNEFLTEGIKGKKYDFKDLIYIFELYNLDKEVK